MEHLSHLTIDALRIGDLAPAEAEAARAHLATCQRCAVRYQELQKDAARFGERFESAALAVESLQRKSAPPRKRISRWVLVALAPVAAGAAAALVLFASRPTGRVVGEAVGVVSEQVRIKGGSAALQIFVADASGVVLAPGGTAPIVPPRATLRVRFDPGDRSHTRILWRDEAGQLAALFPEPAAPALVNPRTISGPRWLERGVQLDGAPGAEQLLAVHCTRPFGHDQALRAVALAGHAAVPEGCQVTWLEVRKTGAR